MAKILGHAVSFASQDKTYDYYPVILIRIRMPNTGPVPEVMKGKAEFNQQICVFFRKKLYFSSLNLKM